MNQAEGGALHPPSSVESMLPADAAAPGEEASYFPLVDGATWLYRHTKADGTDRIENVRLVACASEPERCQAWANYDASKTAFWQGPLDADGYADRTEGILGFVDSQVTRLHKWEYDDSGEPNFEVDYDPGFVRFDNLWIGQPAGTVIDYAYMRTRVDPVTDGEVAEDIVESRLQTYTVVSQHETVAVEAGEFDCIKVHREREAADDTGESSSAKDFWFAPGIGKVKEEHVSGDSAGDVEELVKCSLCE